MIDSPTISGITLKKNTLGYQKVLPTPPSSTAANSTLLASRNALPADFPAIINLIREGKINTDVWITHRITFDEVPEKFAQFTDPNLGAIKAIIEVR